MALPVDHDALSTWRAHAAREEQHQREQMALGTTPTTPMRQRRRNNTASAVDLGETTVRFSNGTFILRRNRRTSARLQRQRERRNAAHNSRPKPFLAPTSTIRALRCDFCGDEFSPYDAFSTCQCLAMFCVNCCQGAGGSLPRFAEYQLDLAQCPLCSKEEAATEPAT